MREIKQKTVPYFYYCHLCRKNQLIRREYEFSGERVDRWLHLSEDRRQGTIICEVGKVALPTEAAEVFTRGLKEYHMNRINKLDC